MSDDGERRAVTLGARRIHIVGGPGSGKSTLAGRLGETLGIAVHSHDTIAYEGPDFRERPLEARLQDVRAIAAAPEWIAEGIHLGWTAELFERAHVIIWLDHVGWLRSALRIVARFARSAAAEVRLQSGTRKFTRFRDYRYRLGQLVRVLMASREFYGPAHSARRYPATRESAERELRPHGAKVVRCGSHNEVERVLAEIHSGAAAAPLPGRP
jgi:adenylate kinase family enzyme